MIHVIATITLTPGTSREFLDVFRRNIPKVTGEKGCIAYGPAMDVDSGIPVQVGPRKDVVTIVEAWESLDALRAHLMGPHMAAYQKATGDMVKGVTLQVLQPV